MSAYALYITQKTVSLLPLSFPLVMTKKALWRFQSHSTEATWNSEAT